MPNISTGINLDSNIMNLKSIDLKDVRTEVKNLMIDDEKIILAYSDEKWIDLKELKLNYIFYQRCWENYLPECYTTKTVIKHSKTCYIPYCFHGLNVKKTYYSSSFFYYF